MANSVRMSSFMLKCSMCSEEIEISMMGDHVCKPVPKQQPLNRKPTGDVPIPNKTPKLPPAPLDTKAANRPFVRPGALTPDSSSSESTSASPESASEAQKISYTETVDKKRSSQGENSATRADNESHLPLFTEETSAKSQYLPTPQQYPEADPRYAPISARSVSSGGLMDKMNAIAPGPFDMRRPSQPSLSEKTSNEDVLAALPLVSNIKGHHARSSTASSMRSHSSKASSASSSYTVATMHSKPVEKASEYAAFSPNPHEENPRSFLGAGSRSNTFPNVPTTSSFAHPRRPSESFASMRRPSNVMSDNNEELDGNTFVRTSPPRNHGRRPSMGGKPPPRGMSFSAGRNISAVNLAAEFGTSNPYHTPSVSQSSEGSSESRTSKVSSGPSPPSSEEPAARRKPSVVTAGLGGATQDLQQAFTQSPATLSPPTQFATATVVTTPPVLDASMLSPESPMDPAIHGGRLSPMPHQGYPASTSASNREPRQAPPVNQGRRPSATAQAPAQRGPSPQHRGPPHNPNPNRGPSPQGGPGYQHNQRPGAPYLPQQGFPPQGRRPSQANVKPPATQYIPYRSPTSDTFPDPGPRPIDAHLPSPQNNQFPQGRRPSHTNINTNLPPPPRQDANQGRRPSTANGQSPQHGQFPQGGRPMQIRPLQPPPEPPASAARRPGGRPTTAKGDCRGCGQPITGKSVSSADGRLTGRYHKECFVCKKCREPFPSATFYVINDSPYCERHYHFLNNSCCSNSTCGKGIEGQFLETERKQKFHPNCFTCMDCRRVLNDDYYELNGRFYCERDAFRKGQQRSNLGPGGMGGKMGGMSRMEKRTTRLMMM